MRVAIVALGTSSVDFFRLAIDSGDVRQHYDEIWAINAYGGLIQADRIFHMDDVRVQEARAAAGNKKIGAMLGWVRKHPGPIYTSRVHPDYPGLVVFPLEAVVNKLRCGWFNNTVAYAVAMAI